MNETTKIEIEAETETGTALALPSKASLQTAFEDGSIDKLIGRIEAEVRSFVPDLTTKKSRAEITSLAYKVARSKTPLDEARKALTEDWRDKTAKVNAHWKGAETRLNDLRDEVAKPLKEWEEADEARKAAHRERLDLFQESRTEFSMTVAEIQAVVDEVTAIIVDDGWEEFQNIAADAKKDALIKFDRDLQAATVREDQDRKIEAMQKAAEEREAEAAKEREAREAEDKARREEQERKDREAKEEQDRLQAEALERQRQADLAAAEENRLAIERARKILAARDLMDHISKCGKGMIDGEVKAFGLLIYELESKVPSEIEKLLDEDKPRVKQHREATLEILKERQEIQVAKDDAERQAQKEADEKEAAARALQAEADRQVKVAEEKAAAEQARRADEAHLEKMLGEVTTALKGFKIADMAQAILDGKIPHVSIEV